MAAAMMRKRCRHGIPVLIKKVKTGFVYISPCKCFKF